MKSMIDPTGKVAHFQYDAVNRADRTQDPLAGIRLFAYDLQDNSKQVTDANGNATYFKYDVHGREVERKNAPGDTWTFAYDSRDNMVKTVDAAVSVRQGLSGGRYGPDFPAARTRHAARCADGYGARGQTIEKFCDALNRMTRMVLDVT